MLLIALCRRLLFLRLGVALGGGLLFLLLRAVLGGLLLFLLLLVALGGRLLLFLLLRAVFGRLLFLLLLCALFGGLLLLLALPVLLALPGLFAVLVLLLFLTLRRAIGAGAFGADDGCLGRLCHKHRRVDARQCDRQRRGRDEKPLHAGSFHDSLAVQRTGTAIGSLITISAPICDNSGMTRDFGGLWRVIAGQDACQSPGWRVRQRFLPQYP